MFEIDWCLDVKHEVKSSLPPTFRPIPIATDFAIFGHLSRFVI